MPVVDPAANVKADGSGRTGEYVCDRCGYGVCCEPPPERCPLCQGVEWRAVRTRRRED